MPYWSEVKAILYEKVVRIQRVGHPPGNASLIAELLGVDRRRIKFHGLDMRQTELAWRCRYNEMKRMHATGGRK